MERRGRGSSLLETDPGEERKKDKAHRLHIISISFET